MRIEIWKSRDSTPPEKAALLRPKTKKKRAAARFLSFRNA